MIITIDGPVGSGKSTIAKCLAEKLDFVYFDTGAMYRCVTYGVIKKKIHLENIQQIENFLVAFSLDIRLKDAWKVYTGVLVKSKLGVDQLTEADLSLLEIIPQEEDGNYAQYINNFLVPALIKYEFPSRIYAEAGPQFGLLYKSWVQFDSDVDGEETRIKIENKDILNRFEVGGVVGMGYRLKPGKGISLGVKYYQGFTNALKGISGSRNNSIYLKCTIPIGAGKTKEADSD